MKTDPIVEEVRSARRQIEQDADKEGLTLGDYLRRNQKTSKNRLVRRGPVFVQHRQTA